jgi:hypothetical protein
VIDPQVYGALRDVVMWIVAVLIFLWGRDRKQVAEAIDQQFVSLRASVAASFELRDQRLNAIDKRIDAGSERASKESGRIIEKMEDFRERLVRVESLTGGRRINDD